MSLTHYILDIAYTFNTCINCFPSPSLHINNRSYKIQRLLGEGGFSYVYLVQASNGEYFALKKIRCPSGSESLQQAMREIDSYKIFNDEHIINLIDSNIIQERDGSKTAYILLPYFRRGNLQDTINANSVNHTRYDEREALQLFLEIAQGVRIMHKHRANPDSGLNTRRTGNNTLDMERESQPLMDDLTVTPSMSTSNLLGSGEAIVPYAHRDIKPANIMLSQTGVPVLMDLGSCMRARIEVTSRQHALELQDYAAEHCTISYRAPELFDVKTNSVLDEGVDIWSLGCTFFALLYCSSPFELQSSESGASLSLAIINGRFRFPDSQYSERTKDIIRACLTVDPKNRPDIDRLIQMIHGALQQV
ncbi:kinase-like domain-containing protein [Lipomyces kononenkoae]|uniref:Kinase-like domain-containing protein n=1 Tax=Lipomyces kononenkoae TaxID=34357 RepID=A0ACC3T5Y6_LIPKO